MTSLGSKLLKNGRNVMISDVAWTCSSRLYGSAGSVKEAGGIFNKRGDAKEAEFFHKKERELIENLKGQMKEQIEFHEEQIRVHQDALDKLKTKQNENL